jgi:hypothetical protein
MTSPRQRRAAKTIVATLVVSASAVAALSACGGGASTTPVASPTGVTTLATAMNTVCVTPSAAMQSVSLPATGGVSGTLTFGAYPAGATGCDNVVIASGTDVVTTQSSLRSAQNVVPQAATSSSPPLLTITVGAAAGGSGPLSPFGFPTIVSGLQLNVGPNITFPDGTYYATVTTSGKTFIIPLTAKSGVLTVSSGSDLPILILAESSAVIAIYPQGVVPPTSTPSPAPSATATATASATPTAVPTSTPTASPTSMPTVIPSGGTVPVGTIIGTSTLTVTTVTPPNIVTSPIVYGGIASLFTPFVGSGGGLVPGSDSYTISGLPVESYRVDGCNGQIGYSGSGTAGVLTFPYPVMLQVSDTCIIDLFSVPASVINADSSGGFEYELMAIAGPVVREAAPYSPAVNIH